MLSLIGVDHTVSTCRYFYKRLFIRPKHRGKQKPNHFSPIRIAPLKIVKKKQALKAKHKVAKVKNVKKVKKGKKGKKKIVATKKHPVKKKILAPKKLTVKDLYQLILKH